MTNILIDKKFLSISLFDSLFAYCSEYQGAYNLCIYTKGTGTHYFKFDSKTLAEKALEILSEAMFDGKTAIRINSENL